MLSFTFYVKCSIFHICVLYLIDQMLKIILNTALSNYFIKNNKSVTLFPYMRSSASEAVSTVTNGVTPRASPSCLPVAGAGTVSSRDTLTKNVSV